MSYFIHNLKSWADQVTLTGKPTRVFIRQTRHIDPKGSARRMTQRFSAMRADERRKVAKKGISTGPYDDIGCSAYRVPGTEGDWVVEFTFQGGDVESAQFEVWSGDERIVALNPDVALDVDRIRTQMPVTRRDEPDPTRMTTEELFGEDSTNVES
jgi:hypothetical protein